MYPEWPTYSSEEIIKVKDVMVSGKVNYWTGKYCVEFEKKFANFFDKKYGISLSSGSVALDVALKSLSLKKNDEVLVTPRSYIASASCVISQNLKPIFIDVDLNSQNILYNDLKKKITKKTKAIILVHLAGYPCEMDEILRLCKQNNIKIIEDCSQAHGAKYKDKLAGSFGDLSIWSFCNDKIMSTGGEGGMILTNNMRYYKKIFAFKDCGKNIDKLKDSSFKPKFKWLHDSVGSNYRMTEMQAVIGIFQLKNLNNWVKKRNSFSKKINNLLSNFSYIRTTKIPLHIFHSFYRCYFFLNHKKTKNKFFRESIINSLRKFKIDCNVGSCPEIYLENAFKKKHKIKRLKNAKTLGETSVALFINHNFDKKHEIKYLTSLNKVLKKFEQK